MSQALMEEVAPAQSRGVVEQTSVEESPLGPRWLPPFILIAASIVGIFVYAWFYEHSEDLWWSMGHDRHSHYMFGLNIALDLRTFDAGRLFHDFDRMRVWGPLHAFVLAFIELAAGPDHRLAVLPSLCGWIVAMWCAFLIPRRLLASGGNTAGVLSAFLVAVSPAHRAFATDCMLESLGAGLSLASIYLYLVVLQDGTRRAAVSLGLTLSALFLLKYNYWLLVVFGLVGGEIVRQPLSWLRYARSLCQRDRLPRWLWGEVKQPFNYIVLAFAAAAGTIAITGGGTVTVAGRTLSMQEPHNFLHLAYLVAFVRGVLWWRQTGRAWSLELPPTVREVLIWHGGVIAVWFLLPKRLSYFLWFLSPNNTDQHREAVPFMHGLPYYLQGLRDDYLPGDWGLYLFAGMLVLGLIAWRQLKPGAAALILFFLIGAYLTCQHPMLKNRFMHSWIAAGWIVGSIGLVYAVQKVAGVVATGLQPWAAGAVCAMVIGFNAPAFLEPGHAQEGGLKPDLPSPLRITEQYLPALAGTRQPTILSNVSTRFLWTWTFIEEHRHQKFAAELKNFKSYENNPEAAKRWLESTKSNALVLIDIRPFTTYDWKTDEYVDLAAFHQALAEQRVWVLSERWEMPEGVTITLWKKD